MGIRGGAATVVALCALTISACSGGPVRTGDTTVQVSSASAPASPGQTNWTRVDLPRVSGPPSFTRTGVLVPAPADDEGCVAEVVGTTVRGCLRDDLGSTRPATSVVTTDGLNTTAAGILDGVAVAWQVEDFSDEPSSPLEPDPTRTTLSAAGSADDLAALAGTVPSPDCPAGALAVWVLTGEPTFVDGLSDACVAPGRGDEVVLGVADGAVLVVGPGVDDRPVGRLLLDVDGAGSFEVTAADLPRTMERVTDVELFVTRVLAGTSDGVPVVRREQDTEPVPIAGETLDPDHPFVDLATDDLDGTLRVALQGPEGIRVCRLTDADRACADGPPGLLVDATASGDDRDALYLTTRSGGRLSVWSGRAPTSG